MNPRAALAAALGVVTEKPGCRCRCCGDSPFPPAGYADRMVGANFVDFPALLDAGADLLCAGCQRLMAGRPGDDPPPLRTMSVLVTPDGTLQQLDMAGWWQLVTIDVEVEPGSVLSWSRSRKRHHWLHAGISAPEMWRVGTDDGPIVWAPDADVAAAVMSLREIHASKGAILAGSYSPRLHAQYRDVIQAAESTLAPLRDTLILDLVVWAAPSVEDRRPRPEEASMIDPADEAAAKLIAELVWGSEMRAHEGKVFWGGYLVRRMRRFARLPLAAYVSRMAGECRVSVTQAASAAGMLERYNEVQADAIERALRQHTDLIHALAFDRVQGIRAKRKQEPPQ